MDVPSLVPQTAPDALDFVLLVISAGDCPTCKSLESSGVFASFAKIQSNLQTIYLERVDSDLWLDYLAHIEGFPKIGCMSLGAYNRLEDESALEEMEFFNHTYDLELKAMLETGNKPVTYQNIRDFCEKSRAALWCARLCPRSTETNTFCPCCT